MFCDLCWSWLSILCSFSNNCFRSSLLHWHSAFWITVVGTMLNYSMEECHHLRLLADIVSPLYHLMSSLRAVTLESISMVMQWHQLQDSDLPMNLLRQVMMIMIIIIIIVHVIIWLSNTIQIFYQLHGVTIAV